MRWTNLCPLTLEDLLDPGRQRRHALDTIDRIEGLHRRILERRNGVPIDVDTVLDELRGRNDGAEAL